jgi:hypothetical protein
VQSCQGFENHFRLNFIPCILILGAAIMILPYKLILQKLKSCPVPLAFGESGTGALLSALGMMGISLYSKITVAKILQLCSSCGVWITCDEKICLG